MPALVNEDWMFDRLLEGASLTLVRICRLYEYAREVTAWQSNSIPLAHVVMLMAHTELLTPLFRFCTTKPGCSRDWLRKPYFKLQSALRNDLVQLYDSHLAGLMDPTDPLHEMPFLPVGSGPPFAAEKSPSPQLRLNIPLTGSNQFARECFDALLRRRFESQEDKRDEGGKAEKRQLKNDLRHLGAWRLLRSMSAREAIQYTDRRLGRPLYAHPSRWSSAKGEAAKIIESFEAELRPIKELLAQAPEAITWAHYDPATGKLQYG
jgi:hypothetical protein